MPPSQSSSPTSLASASLSFLLKPGPRSITSSSVHSQCEGCAKFSTHAVDAASRLSSIPLFKYGSRRSQLLSQIARRHSSFLLVDDGELEDLRSSMVVELGLVENGKYKRGMVAPDVDDMRSVIGCLDGLLSCSTSYSHCPLGDPAGEDGLDQATF